MNNADNNADVVGTPDPVPEGDAAEQSIPAGFDEEPGLDTEYLSDAGDRDANEADVIDQAYIVATSDDDLGADR
ncbi:hypothetical protein VIMS_03114 [Mycobacterium marinum]|uniref:hypothetical protein n=1 Tax=Mycobacterium marinum TaxID=1781 RepID=UPI000E3D8A45|nr:hypothetical protein [Mycobacterium marinum]RFZ12719.1 hypothetical protein VIMS_03114 [Mycobacterium marinum]